MLTERHTSPGGSTGGSAWHPRLQTLLGYILLIAGIVAIANGGVEAAMGPRIDQVFGGSPGNAPTRILVSFALGIAALVTGIGFLVLSGRKGRTD